MAGLGPGYILLAGEVMNLMKPIIKSCAVKEYEEVGSSKMYEYRNIILLYLD